MILPIYYNSPELKTLGDFLKNEGVSPAFAYLEKPNEFLLIEDESGVSNYKKILKATVDEEEKKRQEFLFASLKFNSLKLYPPIVFSIDTKSAKSDLFSTQGDLVQNAENVNYFISKKLAGLLLNPQYVLKSKAQSGGVKSIHPKLTVWAWSRSLSYSLGIESTGLKTDYELINLSPFIDRVTMSSTKEGGSFSFSIAPIKGSLGKAPEGWKIKKGSINFSGSKMNPEYRATSHVEDQNFQSKDFFFHNIIQQNDLIFISFEDLAIEKTEYRNELSVPFKTVNSKIWDLIGLVDTNELGLSKEGQNEVSINVSGRDLTKLIVEDGSYFWATEFGMDGTIRFAGNRDNRIAKRIESGGFNSYFSQGNKAIETSLRFVIGQLANTGLVPNYVFQNYANRRSSIFVNETVGREAVLVKKKNPLNGLPPRLKREEKDVKELKEVIADGVWGITKIIIDPQIANLRLVDSALFVEQGSLINYVKRICQEPFVEFYTETIADQFYWIARKPPYGKRAVLGAINGEYVSDSNELASDELFNLGATYSGNSVGGFATDEGSVFNRTQSFVIDIESLDTIRVNVRFDERAYSWFKFEPRYALGGSQDNLVSLAFLPAVFLPTYTNLFGSRPLNKSSNYVNYIPASGAEGDKNYKNALEQAYYDLAWLIETHAYLPFTRTGTITINEDRRIKKGMHVRLHQTGEIFLVTSLTHELSISKSSMTRTTTLQVERGMVEELIGGKDIAGFGRVSYFDLVSTPINLQRLRFDNRTGERFQPIANWKENESVINYFLQRRQFGL